MWWKCCQLEGTSDRVTDLCMAPRLFGTDGIRGTAGVYPLDRETVARLGAALVRAIGASGSTPRLLSGRDTRESGAWIEREFARGVRSEGGAIVSAGVIPTPAVAFLTGSRGFDAGVVISASHNTFQDNGIKIFSGAGEKFPERLETEVESIMADGSWDLSGNMTPMLDTEDFSSDYIAHARRAFPGRGALASARVAVDCANGAMMEVAPRLFRELGFELTTLHSESDGRNINLGCGSTHPEGLMRVVRDGGYRIGVAFDGDGDRAIFVDSNGRLVDGDAVLFMCAKHFKATGRLSGNAIVATVMSNVGLEMALRDVGIELVRCAVGDKCVMEEMTRRHLSLGGEQSGHVIFAEHLFTGDGLITAGVVLRVMAETGRELSDLTGDLVTYPQVLLNVAVREKSDLGSVSEVADVVARVERQLAGRGRLLVRYSGTEPLLRVMIEGEDQRQISAWAEEIAATVRTVLGA